MSSNSFSKTNLDTYLNELAKSFKKLNGKKASAEIILVGGAAILANYSFRDSTTDMDAVIRTAASMKEAINTVGDKFDLPNGWLNTDFIRTGSYSPKLAQYSVHYRTFSGVLDVRTIKAEYLIAMKLRSGRKYKNDLSDIIGILAEHDKFENPISFDLIDGAVLKLYGGWEEFPEHSRKFIEDAIANGNYEEVYASVRSEESQNKDILVGFEEQYPKVTNQSNVNDILETLRKKKHKNTTE